MFRGQGGWRRRRRNIYSLTGMPGWMRLGYSPGLMGKIPAGLPSTAQYLMQAEQMPRSYPVKSSTQISGPTHGDCANFRDGFCMLYGTAVDPNSPACPSFTAKIPTPVAQTQLIEFPPAQAPQMLNEQELQMLEDQRRIVKQQLELVRKRLEELRKEVP